MSPEKWKEISRIFNGALSRPVDQRAGFIRESCRGDDALRNEVGLLLDALEAENSFFDSKDVMPDEQWVSGLIAGDNLDSFTIERIVGKGGMGEVFLARDNSLNRNVAIKVLPKNNTSVSGNRFLREARAAAALDHPNICTIHEIGETDSLRYIVMQFASGETLAEVLKRRVLEPQEALDYARQIADALAVAHEKGIVHRDIKPANLIVSKEKQVSILDFGLAKRFFPETKDDPGNPSLLSHPGMIMGTASYMSPEQANGQELDHRTDIWSLGVVRL